ncbi:membrane hypothetical protein [Mesorhizobium sp. STM 4661]|nr:membrane hypothetical protein [Mesorhizobium sp. STM 4661]
MPTLYALKPAFQARLRPLADRLARAGVTANRITFLAAAQYIFGKLFGRHLISPNVSPSKTWEGLIGGLAASSLLGALLSFLTPFSVVQAAGVAFIACLMGFLGGLVASAIKSDQGVKDWGHLIEGHGGMMDRADSPVFAAPVFFHTVRYFWT